MMIKFNENLVGRAINNGGDIIPLLVPSELTGGTGLCNPSVFVHNGKVLINIRHVNYTLWHSEKKRFLHNYGPLEYLHPESPSGERALITNNYIVQLNDRYETEHVGYVDTSELDQPPLWQFHGLEDGRLVNWEGKWYLIGVRRDTTDNGQGRMELSELVFTGNGWKEVNRQRIPPPVDLNSYCEKNWMPIIDQPYTFVKWTNPTEIARYGIEKNTTTSYVRDNYQLISVDLRGGSQVIRFRDRYVCLTHEVDFFYNDAGWKDAVYRHRFVSWDADFNDMKFSKPFDFMMADIEFCCGMAVRNNDVLITFGFTDSAAYLLKIPADYFNQLIN